jgi:selenocysteine-specific elongation factor
MEPHLGMNNCCVTVTLCMCVCVSTVRSIEGVVAMVRKIRYFKGDIKSRSKIHVSIGHQTVMATVTFCGARELVSTLPAPHSAADGIIAYTRAPALPFPWDAQEFQWQEELLCNSGKSGDGGTPVSDWQFAVLLFDAPVLAQSHGLVIGSKLDADLHAKSCRLAFYGNIVETMESVATR